MNTDIKYKHKLLKNNYGKPPLNDALLLEHISTKFSISKTALLNNAINEHGYYRIKASGYYLKMYFDKIAISDVEIVAMNLFDREFSQMVKSWIELMEITFTNAMLLLLINRVNTATGYSNIFTTINFKTDDSCEQAYEVINEALIKAELDIIKVDVWKYFSVLSIGDLRMLYGLLRQDVQLELLSKIVKKDVQKLNKEFFEDSLQFINDLRNAANHAEQLFEKKRMRYSKLVKNKKSMLNSHELILEQLLLLAPIGSSTRTQILEYIKEIKFDNNKRRYITFQNSSMSLWDYK